MNKQRLDTLLASRGFFDTREKARRAIMAGEVRVGELLIDKPGTRVAEDAAITVKSANRYVGRGGLKLEAALKHFTIDPTGKICLDIGASTGGSPIACSSMAQQRCMPSMLATASSTGRFAVIPVSSCGKN